MQSTQKTPLSKAKLTGFMLFFISCLTFVAALTLPFVSLPVSTAIKAGLITGIVVLGEVAFATSLALLGKEYVSQLKSLVSFTTIPSGSFYLTAGLLVWLAATLAIRLLGQYVFIPDNTVVIVAAFVGLTILMAMLMPALYRFKRLYATERLFAAVLFALPGIVLDAGNIYFFSWVFPNLPPQADSLFAAWLFWGYSVALLTGLVTIGKRT